MSTEGVFVKGIDVNGCAKVMDRAQVYTKVSERNPARKRSILSPKSRPVGENTLSTVSTGFVHPGGGSCFAAA
jgi:hypothetical protein